MQHNIRPLPESNVKGIHNELGIKPTGFIFSKKQNINKTSAGYDQRYN